VRRLRRRRQRKSTSVKKGFHNMTELGSFTFSAQNFRSKTAPKVRKKKRLRRLKRDFSLSLPLFSLEVSPVTRSSGFVVQDLFDASHDLRGQFLREWKSLHVLSDLFLSRSTCDDCTYIGVLESPSNSELSKRSVKFFGNGSEFVYNSVDLFGVGHLKTVKTLTGFETIFEPSTLSKGRRGVRKQKKEKEKRK
jgi:hypothetical protein